jgi:hypothetical protein
MYCFKGTIARDMLDRMERALMKAYTIVTSFINQVGRNVPPSFKLLLHFADAVRLFGPLICTSLWAFERKNADVLRNKTNNKYAISSSWKNSANKDFLRLRDASRDFLLREETGRSQDDQVDQYLRSKWTKYLCFRQYYFKGELKDFSQIPVPFRPENLLLAGFAETSRCSACTGDKCTRQCEGKVSLAILQSTL